MGKAQYSLEFAMIFVLSFMVFLLMITIVIRLVDSNTEDALKRKLDIIADMVKNEAVLAQKSQGEFSSVIDLPETSGGEGFSIGLDKEADMLVVRSTVHDLTVFRAMPDIEEDAEVCLDQAGCSYRITKKGGKIEIKPVPPCTC